MSTLFPINHSFGTGTFKRDNEFVKITRVLQKNTKHAWIIMPLGWLFVISKLITLIRMAGLLNLKPQSHISHKYIADDRVFYYAISLCYVD
jgi:hypothetical protein